MKFNSIHVEAKELPKAVATQGFQESVGLFPLAQVFATSNIFVNKIYGIVFVLFVLYLFFRL